MALRRPAVRFDPRRLTLSLLLSHSYLPTLTFNLPFPQLIWLAGWTDNDRIRQSQLDALVAAGLTPSGILSAYPHAASPTAVSAAATAAAATAAAAAGSGGSGGSGSSGSRPPPPSLSSGGGALLASMAGGGQEGREGSFWAGTGCESYATVYTLVVLLGAWLVAGGRVVAAVMVIVMVMAVAGGAWWQR